MKSLNVLQECRPWSITVQNAKHEKNNTKCKNGDMKYPPIYFWFFAFHATSILR